VRPFGDWQVVHRVDAMGAGCEDLFDHIGATVGCGVVHQIDRLRGSIKRMVGRQHHQHLGLEVAGTVPCPDYPNLSGIEPDDAADWKHAHTLDELLHERRFKVPSAPLIHLAQCLKRRDAGMIDPVASDGIVGIDDGADEAELANLTPLEMVDIAGAAVAFVMRPGNLDCGRRETLGIFQHRHTERDVAL